MRATQLLQDQHQEVEARLDALERGSADDRDSALREMAAALAGHMVIEEEMLYPAAMDVDRDTVLASQEEHELAAGTLGRLLDDDQDEHILTARLRVLRRLLEDHMDNEEHRLFPKVEKILSDAKLEAMGQRMEARFDEVLEAGPEAALAMRPSAVAAAGKPAPEPGRRPVQPGGAQPGQLRQQPDQEQPGTQESGDEPPEAGCPRRCAGKAR